MWVEKGRGTGRYEVLKPNRIKKYKQWFFKNTIKLSRNISDGASISQPYKTNKFGIVCAAPMK